MVYNLLCTNRRIILLHVPSVAEKSVKCNKKKAIFRLINLKMEAVLRAKLHMPVHVASLIST